MLQPLTKIWAQRVTSPFVALLGVFVPQELMLPNAQFERDLSGWTVTAPAGSVQHGYAPSTRESCAVLRVGGGATATLELEVGIGSAGDIIGWLPVAGQFGERPRFGARVMAAGSSDAGSIVLEVDALGAEGPRALARSEISVRRLGPDRWVWLEAAPLGSGRLQAGDMRLRFRLSSESQDSSTTQLFVDQCAARLHEEVLEPLVDGDFEEPLVTGGPWETWGVVLWSDPLLSGDDYNGVRHAVLAGRGVAGLRQTLPLHQAPFQLSVNDRPEAGVWVRVDPQARLGRSPDPDRNIELRLLGSGRGRVRLLGSARWSPASSDRGTWRYLEVTASSLLQIGHEEISVEVAKTFSGQLSVDSVSLGVAGGVHGHPQRLVGCNYVGRYSSVAWQETAPGTPGLQWRNWRWTSGTPCDPGWDELDHDPDCDVNPDCRRSNGRRDAAVSTLSGASNLPLAGTYDSRDPAIARYHVRLAQALGIDHFVFDHLGHTLAEQTRSNGMDALNEDSFEVLLEEVDALDGSFRVAIMYEPKVHFLGWIAEEKTPAQMYAGVVRDLIHFASTYGRRRGVLRHDGRLVVHVFRNSVEWGGLGMSSEAWWDALREVERRTGERLFLIADNDPGDGSAFEGLSRWNLVSRDYLRFRTFGDLRHRTPSWPEASVSTLEAHARDISECVRAWSWREEEGRVASVVVWPGFDDSGVAGWGSENLIGEDGLPLCVRVADPMNGAFFATTQAAALEVRPDWIQIATWNDWNELTQIEPSWHPELEEQLAAGALSPEVLHHCFGRALEAQSMTSVFMGVELSPADVVSAAASYLAEVRSDPGAPAYD